MSFQGKFNFSATAKPAKKIPSFYLYAVLDKDDLRTAEFSYWVDLGEIVGGVDAVVEMCGAFRNKKYYSINYLREDIEAATGLNAEPLPDLNIWEIIPGDYNAEGEYEWPLSNLDPPWEDVAVPGSAGSSSAGRGGADSWHPYGRIAYAINVHGTVEWGGPYRVSAVVSGGTQCAHTTADGKSGHTGVAQRKWGYLRGISAQDGSGRKYGPTDGFEPVRYKINNASAYGSCWAYLQGYHCDWYRWHPGEPSPNRWETHDHPLASAYTTDGACNILTTRGADGNSSFRAGRESFSPAGPGSNNTGPAKLIGPIDCGGYSEGDPDSPDSPDPPLLLRFNPGHDGSTNSFRPGGKSPEEYDNPPSKEPPVQLPAQPTMKVFIGSSEWSPIKIYECTVGEFFAMHPLDIEDFEINDPKNPAFNVHPIQKLLEISDQWMPLHGINWGQEQQVYGDEGTRYSDVIPGQAKTYFSERSPGIGETSCAHHLVVISSRHQVVILKLGAMPLFGINVANSPEFVTQRVILINIFDGVPSVSRIPVPLAQQAWEYYFNGGRSPDNPNDRNEVNDFRYPEAIQKYLRYHFWYHRGHYEAVYIRVDRQAGQESIETNDKTRETDRVRAEDKPNVSYFGTSDFVTLAEQAWYNRDGSIRRIQGMPFQRVELDFGSSGDSPYYDDQGDGSLNRDYIGYVLTSTSRLDLEKLWVCVGVGNRDWEKTFGSIVPTKLCYTHEETFDSAPWLYLAKSWTSLGTVQLKFLESNIKLGEHLPKTDEGYIDFKLFQYKWREYWHYRIEYDPDNPEEIKNLKLNFGDWLTTDYVKNWQDYGWNDSREDRFTSPPTQMRGLGIGDLNTGAYTYNDPIRQTLYWQPKKNATLYYSTLTFPALSPQSAILLGVAGISTSQEIPALIPRFYGGIDEEERHQLSREDRNRIFREDQDFYREIENG